MSTSEPAEASASHLRLRTSSLAGTSDPALNEDIRAQDEILDEEHIYRDTHPEHKKPKISCFHAIFATRQLASRGNRELYIAFSVRECIIYIFYLATITIILLSLASGHSYYYTRVIHNLFVSARVTESETDSLETGSKTFETSSDTFDFWNYFHGPLIHNMHWEYWYGSSENLMVRELRGSEKDHGILYENRLMGFPRLRQIRVKKSGCPSSSNWRYLNRQCYSQYAEIHEELGKPFKDKAKRPIGVFWDDVDISSDNPVRQAWKPTKGGYSYWGEVATYSGNGATIGFKGNSEKMMKHVKALQDHRWITRSTRAVFLDFTVYNANLNLFCVVKLLWEFSCTGGLTTSYSLRTVTLIRYISTWDYWVTLPCEILFIVFTVYYLIQEITEMVHLGCKEYVQDWWSWYDLANLSISFACIVFSFYQQYLVKRTLGVLTTNKNSFPDFEFLAFMETVFTIITSICVFFAWLKVIKYVSFNQTMAELSNTLTRCARDVMGFSLMFFIVFFAFAQLGYLVFGTQLEDYRSLARTVFTLLRILLGDFNFRQLILTNRILGPIYFLSYAFFIFFVLLNMFLAIINDNYGEVKKELDSKRVAFELSDYLKSQFNKVRGKFGKRSERIDAETAIKIAAEDGQITKDELRQSLRRSGRFHTIEIEMFLSHFDLEEDQVLDDEGITNFLADLEGRDIPTQDGAVDHVLHERHYHRERVEDRLTEPIPILPEDIDALVDKIGSMELVLTEVLNNMVEVEILVDEALQQGN